MKIIAGPCSVDYNNIKEIYEIAKLPIWGVRCVGLKSVTNHSKDRFLGIDYEAYLNKESLFPSIEMAKEVIRKTGKIVAVELMEPATQLPFYDKAIPEGKLFGWNPSTNQLGWPIRTTGFYAAKNKWWIGLKNGKWVGDVEVEINGVPLTNMEKNWAGNVSFAEAGGQPKERIVMIHRGVDKPDKGEYRYPPSHESAKRVKKVTGCQVWFDPSHCFGKNLRHKIVEETIKALKMKCDEGFLYDGLLIEVGHAQTDTFQHISVEEFKHLLNEISSFRLIYPETLSF